MGRAHFLAVVLAVVLPLVFMSATPAALALSIDESFDPDIKIELDPVTHVLLFLLGGVVGGMFWVPVFLYDVFFRPPLGFMTSVPLALLAAWVVYLKAKKKLKLVYVLPAAFGLVGGVASYAMAKDKKLGMRLAAAGLAVSVLLWLLILYVLKNSLFYFLPAL